MDNTVAGSCTLTVGSGDATSAFSGIIRDTLGTVNLTKTGTGTLTLSGNNQYEGVTKVEQGTLSITDRFAQARPMGRRLSPTALP